MNGISDGTAVETTVATAGLLEIPEKLFIAQTSNTESFVVTDTVMLDIVSLARVILNRISLLRVNDRCHGVC